MSSTIAGAEVRPKASRRFRMPNERTAAELHGVGHIAWDNKDRRCSCAVTATCAILDRSAFDNMKDIRMRCARKIDAAGDTYVAIYACVHTGGVFGRSAKFGTIAPACCLGRRTQPMERICDAECRGITSAIAKDGPRGFLNDSSIRLRQSGPEARVRAHSQRCRRL